MYKITIIPQIVILTATLTAAGITGVGHRKGPYTILDREVLNDPGTVPEPTGAFSEWLQRTGRSNGILDISDIDGFGQHSTNLEAYVYGGNMLPDISSPGGSFAIAENLNPEPTGILQEILIGDGKSNWRVAVEGADIEVIDIGAGLHPYTRRVPGAHGEELVSTRVLKNLHPISDHSLAFLRNRISGEF